MTKWISCNGKDWYNSEKWFHIWIEKLPNGRFCAWGEFLRGENVPLSHDFDTQDECKLWISQFHITLRYLNE